MPAPIPAPQICGTTPLPWQGLLLRLFRSHKNSRDCTVPAPIPAPQICGTTPLPWQGLLLRLFRTHGSSQDCTALSHCPDLPLSRTISQLPNNSSLHHSHNKSNHQADSAHLQHLALMLSEATLRLHYYSFLCLFHNNNTCLIYIVLPHHPAPPLSGTTPPP